MLDKLLDALAPGWVGSVIGLLGIVAAAVTYFLGRQRSILAYRTKGLRLLGNTESGLPSDVTVQYRGMNIPRLTKSLIVIWNFGEKTINGSDVVETDPLRVEMGDDSALLSILITKTSRDVIGVTLIPSLKSPGRAEFSFKYLDPNDGFVIEVLHTGESRHAKVYGTVKGIPQGIKNLGALLSQSRASTNRIVPRSRRTLGTITVLVGSSFVLAGIFFPFTNSNLSSLKSTVVPYAMVVVGLLYAGLGCTLLWIMRRRYPRALQSEDLE